MKSSGNDKQLDERIRDAIGREGLKFDFDKWKTGHQRQIEQFKASVSKESVEPAQLSLRRVIIGSRLSRLTAAAVVIAAVGVLFYFRQPGSVVDGPKTAKVDRPATANIEKSSPRLLTAVSLNRAFRRGGMEAVEEQYEKFFRKAGPRPAELTVKDLFKEFNGG